MKSYNKILKFAAPALCIAILGSCSDDFLKPEPLSFYEPEATFSTESGLQAALAICDRHLRRHMMSENTNTIPLATELEFSEMAACGKTDWGSGFQDNWAGNLTPTSWMNTNFNDGAMAGWFWNNGYDHVKYSNTVLDYVDKVAGLDEDIKNEYKGRAYFHRAWAYYNLVFQYGDVPLVTSLPVSPKQDYRSLPKLETLKMCVANLEDAVKWVPSQKDMNLFGMVNKEACKMLLAKCYLAIGEWKKAEQTCDDLIDNSGLKLMYEPFGTFEETAAPKTWPITRNVIWDLHRPCNKILAANTELILGMPNVSEQSFQAHPSMRVLGPHYSNASAFKTPDNQAGAVIDRIQRTHPDYNEEHAWLQARGRSIGIFSSTYFAQHSMWYVNGVEDTEDLRHNSKVGNWLNMEDMTYTNKKSSWYGKKLVRYAPEDVVNGRGKVVIAKGQDLCSDSIRSWADVPLYKIYYRSQADDDNIDSNDYNGATTGSNGNFYLYRLAEAYLVRAEAKVHQGLNGPAAQDLNELRRRAKCSQLYTTANIGDVMNERGRELYMEEFRHVELVRASMCLAMSGQPDEWGNVYDIKTWDKQSGTDMNGGSYWYQRLMHYSYYRYGNQGIKINSGTQSNINYSMDKHNLYWPVPNDAIVGNKFVRLNQNYGYDGYALNGPMWETWQEADAACRQ